jgi:hypothetical protein
MTYVHLSRECRGLLGVAPGEFHAQTGTACACGATTLRPAP